MPVHRILLVEDSDDDALLVQSELAKTGRRFAFRRVDNARDMQQALTEARWDVVISDHHMPGFDSIQAYHLVRRHSTDTPFIILSGAIAEQTALRAMRLGAHDCVDKTNLARLVPVVERELRHAGLRRSKECIEQSLAHLTYHDQLTGLPNRQMLSRLIDDSLGAHGSASDGAALLHIDLYRFMRINESLGIASGDALLKQVAARLTAALADRGVVGRFGQDKFAVFVEAVGDDAAARDSAQAVIGALAEPFTLAGEEVHLTCTIGIARAPQAARDAPELLRNAERAMAEAKRLGPGSVCIFTPDAQPGYGNALRLENALRHAVRRRELYLDYQPCLDTSARRVTGTEALVRWRHPTFGLMPPDAFIPLADETGLIVDLGRWVLGEACRQNHLWHRAGMAGFTVAVNVSGGTVSARGLRRPGGGGHCRVGDGPDDARARDHRNRRDAGCGVEHPDAAQAEEHGRAHRHRRLRHRLLVAVLPQAPAHRHPQDRPLVRAESRHRRRQPGDRAPDRRAGQVAEADADRRGGGGVRATRVPARTGLRSRAGLPHQPPGGAWRHRGALRLRGAADRVGLTRPAVQTAVATSLAQR
ncbi:MAG: diguanylate cyclase [Betaproteobacteria bacterium]|nr:diguanylate cyclase [Betaproteobacteria bacterium]